MTGSLLSGKGLYPDRLIGLLFYELQVGFSVIRNLNEER
jgi:hypothetical protein